MLSLSLMPEGSFGQSPPPAADALTMEQAVATALKRYPAIRVSESEVRGAAAAIQLARTAFLPRLEAIAGFNRATRNNVAGLLLPTQVIAPITGPVPPTYSFSSAWGSTAGALVTWEPFDFGLREANVAVAEAGRNRAQAGVARSRFDVSVVVADSVLTVLAGEQTVAAAQAAVERARELERITEALVKAELRPGAEASLARAEQAASQTQLIRARQAVAEARATLGALLGVEPGSVQVASGKLLAVPGETSPAASSDPAAHPLAREQRAIIAESQARLQALDRSYYPRFTLQGTYFGRGTGALPDGRVLGGWNGLGPDVQNWGAGLTATFPVFDFASIRARRSAESARREAEQGRYDQVLIDLKARLNRSLAVYEGALQVAQVTPVSVEAAQAALTQARARYQSGLGAALEVADAQRRLTQAEIDNSLARLNIWRSRLAVLASAGDIDPLLREASQ